MPENLSSTFGRRKLPEPSYDMSWIVCSMENEALLSKYMQQGKLNQIAAIKDAVNATLKSRMRVP